MGGSADRLAERWWAAHHRGLGWPSTVEERVAVAHHLKAVIKPPERLAVAQQEPSAGHQRRMHRVDHVEHDGAIEVDQHVPAQDEIETRYGWTVRGQVVLPELHQLTQLGPDLPAEAVPYEIPLQVLIAQQAHGPLAVATFASGGQRGRIDVGAYDTNVPIT